MKKKFRADKVKQSNFIIMCIYIVVIFINLFSNNFKPNEFTYVLIILLASNILMMFIVTQSLTINTKTDNLKYDPLYRIRYQTIDWDLNEVRSITHLTEGKIHSLKINFEFEAITLKLNLFSVKQIKEILDFLQTNYPKIKFYE